MATSKFLRTFRSIAGAPITTATIWLVPQANTYPTGALALTAHGTRDGQYYRDNVPDGEYKIYIDPAGGSSPTLYEERLWIGDQRVTTISDHFDSADSYKLKSTGVKDAAITTTKIADDAITELKIPLSLKLNQALPDALGTISSSLTKVLASLKADTPELTGYTAGTTPTPSSAIYGWRMSIVYNGENFRIFTTKIQSDKANHKIFAYVWDTSNKVLAQASAVIELANTETVLTFIFDKELTVDNIGVATTKFWIGFSSFDMTARLEAARNSVSGTGNTDTSTLHQYKPASGTWTNNASSQYGFYCLMHSSLSVKDVLATVDSKITTAIDAGNFLSSDTTIYEEVRDSDNIINPSALVQGKYFQNNTIYTSSSYAYSGMTPVLPSTTYKALCKLNEYNQFRFHCFFDVDGVYISSGTENVSSFTTPSNCYFVVITTRSITAGLPAENSGMFLNSVSVWEAYGLFTLRLKSGYIKALTGDNDFITKGDADSLYGAGLPTLSLPDKVIAVVGNTLQLFFRGIIKSLDYTQYHIQITCDIGSRFKRYYEIIPVIGNVGNHTLTFTVKSLSGLTLVEGTTTIEVVNKVNNPASVKNILCVGDSFANSADDWPDLLADMAIDGTNSLMGTITNVEFVGNLGTAPKQYVGNSGWSWSNYNSASSPFWNVSAVDFANWWQTNFATKYGLGQSIDVAVFLLGWNNLGISGFDLTNARAIIDQLHSDFPSCKIVVMGIQIPNDLSSTRDWVQDMKNIHLQNADYQDWVNEVAYSGFMSWGQCSLVYDSENNMNTTTKAVNTRSTATELINVDDVHPGQTATSNYYPFADVAMRWLIKLLCQ